MFSNRVRGFWRRLFAAGVENREASATGYTALISAAFCVAVLRRFAKDHRAAAVIGFIAAVRSVSEQLSDKIDPRAAERLIQSVFTLEKVAGVSQEMRFRLQFLLVAALIVDEHLDGPGLDEFMTESRKVADEWLR